MDLNAIAIFAKVIDAGSFVGASRALGIPKSTVSRKVSELEEELGARLLQRTTRTLHLTDAGEAFHRHAVRVLAEVEEAERAVTFLQDVPRGVLRVTTPLSFGFFGPIIGCFLTLHPEVRAEIICTDRLVDLVQEGFDVAIRTGTLADSSLIARSLGTLKSYVVATPDFFEAHGVPESPEDLARFDAVVFGVGMSNATWRLFADGQTTYVEVKPRLIVNDPELLIASVLEGVGIGLVPAHLCVDHLRSGRLRRVLADYCSPSIPVSAVYPSTRHISPKVKAFLDHLSEGMNPPPWEVEAG